jgi:hypothetical protein
MARIVAYLSEARVDMKARNRYLQVRLFNSFVVVAPLANLWALGRLAVADPLPREQ